MSSTIRLTESERDDAMGILFDSFPGSYVLGGSGESIHKRLGPVTAKAGMTDGEIVNELERTAILLDSRSSRLQSLLASVGRERRECEDCGKLFIAHRSDQRFCPGGKCSNRFHQRKRREG